MLNRLKRTRLTMDRLGAVGVMVGTVAATAPALAQTLRPAVGLSDGQRGFFSPLDNPTLLSEFTLAPGMSVERPSVSSMVMRGFGLWAQLSCGADESAGCDPAFTRTPWQMALPRAGSLPVDVPSGGIYSSEQHGMRIGNASVASLWQEVTLADGNSATSTKLLEVPIRLAPGTIVVPVNMAVVVPADDSSPAYGTMSGFATPEVAGVYLDDRWGINNSRFPQGVIEHVNRIVTRSKQVPASLGLGLSVPESGPYQTPPMGRIVENAFGDAPFGFMLDDIFAQCGVQFQLADFVVHVEDDDQIVSRVTNRGTPEAAALCGVNNENSLLAHFNTAINAQVANPKLPLIVFNYRVDAPLAGAAGASDPTCFEVAWGVQTKFIDRGSVIVVGTEAIASGRAPRLTTAHEIGHALGLAHSGNELCQVDAGTHELMCANATRMRARIAGCDTWEGESVQPYGCEPGLVPNHCDTIRASARVLAALAAGGDSTPPVVEPLSNQSLECLGGGRATTLSGFAADPESGIATASWTNTTTNAQVGKGGSPLSIGVFAPVGTTTYRFRATNGSGLISDASMSVSVADTLAPTFPVLNAVTPPDCASGVPIQLGIPAASDACSAATVSGQVVSSDGQALATPINVSPNGAVSLAAGSHVIRWTARDASGNTTTANQELSILACLTAGSALQIADNVDATGAAGRRLALVNLGTGVTELGASAKTGSITAGGAVTLRSQSLVSGNVRARGAVVAQAGAQVDGLTYQNVSSLPLPPKPSILGGAWPTACSGSVHLEPQQAGTLPVGCYSQVVVKSGATLRLTAAGHFRVRRLQLEPQSRLVVPAGVFMDVLEDLVFRGAVVDAQSQPASIGLQFRGTNSVYLEAPFRGAVRAPAAALTLGGTSGQSFVGQFYADRLDVRANIKIQGDSSGAQYLTQYVTQSLAPADGEQELGWDDEEVGLGCAWVPSRRSNGAVALVTLVLFAVVTSRRRKAAA